MASFAVPSSGTLPTLVQRPQALQQGTPAHLWDAAQPAFGRTGLSPVWATTTVLKRPVRPQKSAIRALDTAALAAPCLAASVAFVASFQRPRRFRTGGTEAVQCCRRDAALAGALASTAGLFGGADAAGAESQPKMSVTKGVSADDLVYLGWFAGEWDCTAALLSVELGQGGEKELSKTVPGAEAAFRACQASVGTGKAVKRVKCRWSPTSVDKNGISPGFAIEEAGGICAGTVAASRTLAGSDADIKFVRGEQSAWEVSTAKGDKKWSLVAAASVGQPDVDGEGSFRVSEIFEVRSLPVAEGKDVGPPTALIRVGTVYRRGAVDEQTKGQPPAKAVASTPGPNKPYIIQGLQTAALLAPPSTPGGAPGQAGLSTYTALLTFAPAAA